MSEAQPPQGPQRDWEALARRAAEHGDAPAAVEEVVQLLSFELDGAPYAVPVERVREIVRMRPITPIPRVPESVRGVISLRGEIIEVVDLRLRLGLPLAEPGRRTRIIVVSGAEERSAAILVDAVQEVLRVTRDAIRSAAASESGAVDSLCADGERFVSLIDLDQVLAVQ